MINDRWFAGVDAVTDPATQQEIASPEVEQAEATANAGAEEGAVV